MQFADVNTAVW